MLEIQFKKKEFSRDMQSYLQGQMLSNIYILNVSFNILDYYPQVEHLVWFNIYYPRVRLSQDTQTPLIYC